jgi:hypothetical protein
MTPEERLSFREYAEANRTEPDGTESQWAAYTLKALAALEQAEAEVKGLRDESIINRAAFAISRDLEAELAGCIKTRNELGDGMIAAREECDVLEAKLADAHCLLRSAHAAVDPEAWPEVSVALAAALDSCELPHCQHLAQAEAKLAALVSEREAIQNDSRVLAGVFCGRQYDPGTPRSNHEALKAHVAVCASHPAAEFRKRAEQAEAKLAAVVALHRPCPLYDECGHDHQEGEPGVIYVDEVGLTCDAGRTGTVCMHCHTDGDGMVREDAWDAKYPCDTLKAAGHE